MLIFKYEKQKKKKKDHFTQPNLRVTEIIISISFQWLISDNRRCEGRHNGFNMNGCIVLEVLSFTFSCKRKAQETASCNYGYYYQSVIVIKIDPKQ